MEQCALDEKMCKDCYVEMLKCTKLPFSCLECLSITNLSQSVKSGIWLISHCFDDDEGLIPCL